MPPTNRVHVVALTHNCLFRGVVVTGKKRLSDVLNDRITAYMELQNTRAYNLRAPDKAIYETALLYLKKQRVDAIVILKEEENATPRRIYSYVRKDIRSAVLFLRTLQVHGNIHLQGKHEVHGPLTREGELYLPVTGATLYSTINPRVVIAAQTILLREAALDGFYVAEEEKAPVGELA